MESFEKIRIIHEFYSFATGEEYPDMLTNRPPLKEFISGHAHFGYGERSAMNDIIYFAYLKLNVFDLPDTDKVYISSEYFPINLTAEQQENFEKVVDVLGSEFSKGARISDPDFHLNKTMLYQRFEKTDDLIISKPDFNWMQKGVKGNDGK